MIRVAILGDIGSGKSYVARTFGYPVFNADDEVGKIYKENKKIFKRLKKILPNYLHSFPISKIEISNAILANNKNLKKIVKIVHPEIKKKMNIFLKKHNNKKIVVLDIPLLLENKINKKEDILVYVQSKKLDILRKLKKRKNFNQKLFNKFKKIQLPLNMKKKNRNL
ncbi:dephospho-CoA kinase [Candidatus Pelagibacter bacterium nBUS_30]|uniref:dephospho-CoA kinase n=1 Tax=Candidatus Pelagibacter bacterium nBUS_30 TaxID=3374191 RepID=UPI003EBD218A